MIDSFKRITYHLYTGHADSLDPSTTTCELIMTTQSKLTPSDLSALMCSRICHDLISPVGALGTALEVLGDDSNVDMHGDALELVKMSAKQASSKLQYLRMAFGAAGSSKSSVGVDELKLSLIHISEPTRPY